MGGRPAETHILENVVSQTHILGTPWLTPETSSFCHNNTWQRGKKASQQCTEQP